MRVEIRDVGDVVAVLLHPVGEREFPEQELARADRKRRVQNLAILAVGPVEARLDVRAPVPHLLAVVVERILAGPAVVSVPGGVGDLEEKVGLAIVADDEDDVALELLALGRQLAEVDAAGPIGGDRDRRARGPRAFAQPLGADGRVGLDRCP